MDQKFKIQYGVVKRMKKEYDYYQKEVNVNEDKIIKMKNKELGVEDDHEEHKYKIRKLDEIISESHMMLLLAKEKYKLDVEKLELMYNEIKKCEFSIDESLLQEANTLIDNYYQFM
tara:strand:- start:15 stop:362 length:348 start_codon:yes stop_codon:yes gene_type:complete